MRTGIRFGIAAVAVLAFTPAWAGDTSPDAAVARESGVRATVQDPKNYTEPWSARFVYDFHPELRLEAYVCGEAHRDLSKVKGVRGF